MDCVYVSAIGQDSHCFEPNGSQKPLTLGGVVIQGTPGLVDNSDADVILHAITNAISGISGVNILGKISDGLCRKGITDSRAYLANARIRQMEADTPVNIGRSQKTASIKPYSGNQTFGCVSAGAV